MRQQNRRFARATLRAQRAPYSIQHSPGFHGALRGFLALVSLLGCGESTPSPPEQHPNVLVIVNGESELSVAIGRYYMQRRGIPEEQRLDLAIPIENPSLTTSAHQPIRRKDFDAKVRHPIEHFLEMKGWKQRIDTLVTTKGVPLRVAETAGTQADFTQRTTAALDAELAILFSGETGSAGFSATPNPFYGATTPFRNWREANPDAALRYLVGRLTGYSSEIDEATGVPVDIKHLIDDAQGTNAGAVWLIDMDPDQWDKRSAGNDILLAPAVDALRGLNLPVIHDRTSKVVAEIESIAGYASWGSNDTHAVTPYYGLVNGRRVPGRFASRSIAVDLVSTNARSFSEPPKYGQSLIADLVRAGLDGAAGNALEPTLSAIASPSILLGSYARGVRAAESFYRALPYLGWAGLYIGDPLMTIGRPAKDNGDLDGDGVGDVRDNCIWLPNWDQRDTNEDGFGNACDPDIDNDGYVESSNGEDPHTDIERIQRATHHGLYVPEHDLDGNGIVDEHDTRRAIMFRGLPPGPSALKLP